MEKKEFKSKLSRNFKQWILSEIESKYSDSEIVNFERLLPKSSEDKDGITLSIHGFTRS